MRRFKRAWKDAACQWAKACWHTPEYKYWIASDYSKIELAEVAMKEYRSKLNSAYANLLRHPRSKKTQTEIESIARELGSVALYALEHGAKI